MKRNGFWQIIRIFLSKDQVKVEGYCLTLPYHEQKLRDRTFLNIEAMTNDANVL